MATVELTHHRADRDSSRAATPPPKLTSRTPLPERTDADPRSRGGVLGVSGGAVMEAAGDNVARAERRARAREHLREHQEGTYIGDILRSRDSAIVRWADRDRPLRVWVRDTMSESAWEARFVEEVLAGFRSWESSGVPLRFAFVGDSAPADIRVTWVDRFHRPVAGRPISGLTRWGVDEQSRIVDAVITLALRRPGGDVLPGDAVHAMALHEIGHALGLDHCEDARSVMAPTVQVRALSPADMRTARLLYSLPPGALN